MTNSTKRFVVIGALGTACATVVRVIQILSITEGDTGFFKKGYHALGLAASLFVFFITFAAAMYACFTPKRKITPHKTTFYLAISEFLLAAAILYEAIISQIGSNVPDWQLFLQMIFGLLSAGVFAMDGISFFTEKKVSPILSVFHILFWLVRVIVVFSSYITVSVVAENVFELSALCLSLLFFLNISKFQNGVGKLNSRGLTALGIATFIMCVTYSVPQIIAYFVNGQPYFTFRGLNFITDAFLALYIVCFYATTLLPEKEDEPIIEEAPEPEPEENEMPVNFQNFGDYDSIGEFTFAEDETPPKNDN